MTNYNMNELQKIFNYEGHQVRTLVIDGEPWFVAKDLCNVLEIGNPSQALSRLDEDEKQTIDYENLHLSLNDRQSMVRHLTVVNEPGLYGLILGSRKPEAKAFKRWVKHEVLPAIRKTGTYSKRTYSHAELMHMITGEILKHDKQLIELKQRMDDADAKLDETQETFINVLSEPSDRAKFNRKVKDLARLRFRGRVNDAYSVIYQRIREMYGIDVVVRTFNERRKLQQERREKGLTPYAQSTLEAKVSYVDTLERLGYLSEAMEIVVGSIAKFWKEKGKAAVDEAIN